MMPPGGPPRSFRSSAGTCVSSQSDQEDVAWTSIATSLIEQIELTTGETIDDLRRTPISDRREAIEKKKGSRMVVSRFFPFIGRGNVLRDKTISREEVEQQLDEALR